MIHDLSSCNLGNSAEMAPSVHGGSRSHSALTWLLKILEQGSDVMGKMSWFSISGPNTGWVLACISGNTLKQRVWQSQSRPRRGAGQQGG